MTETQILLALEMLDVPAGEILYRTDQLGLNATPFLALTGPQTAVTAIRATIASLSAEQDEICTGLVTQYLAVCGRVAAGVSIQSGGVDGIQGLTMDPMVAKADLKMRLKNHLPFYADWSKMETRDKHSVATRCGVLM